VAQIKSINNTSFTFENNECLITTTPPHGPKLNLNTTPFMKVMYLTNILAFHTPQTLPQEPQNYWIFYIPIYVVQCKPLPMGRIFYFIIFVDEYSKYTNVLFLFKKFDTSLDFQKYKTKAKNHTSGKIKMWHFDNGGEFIFQHFHQFCSDYGIQFQFVIIYNPT